MYRLLRAETRTVKGAGSWAKWAENLSPVERTNMSFDLVRKMIQDGQKKLLEMLEQSASYEELARTESRMTREVRQALLAGDLGNKPKNVIVGMIDRPLYTFTGWILEKWKPATSYGSPADWYGFRFQGQCCIGEYPYYGDYEIVAGPTPYCLTAKEVEFAIRDDFRQIQTKEHNPMQRVRLMLDAILAEQNKQHKKMINDITSVAMDDASIMNRISLGAGIVRQQMAEKAGLRGSDYGN
jgi:hypothetical protein